MNLENPRSFPSVWLTPDILEYFRRLYGPEAFVASVSACQDLTKLAAAQALLGVYNKLKSFANWEETNEHHPKAKPAPPASAFTSAASRPQRDRASSEVPFVLSGEA